MYVPVATYRLQFTPQFTFASAEQIIPYLARLGVSDIYASPIFKAKKGSMHGYDVLDHNVINPELGGSEGLEKVFERLKEHRLRWFQDIVPNHMAFDSENEKLMDVLESGSASRYAGFFDINWDHPFESIRGKLLAPFLGSFYGESLEKREIQLEYSARGFRVSYYNLCFPLRIESYINILTHNFVALRKRLPRDHPDVIKFYGVLYALKNLATDDPQEHSTQTLFIKRMLWELYSQNDDIHAFIDENVERFNGVIGQPESFNLLDTLMGEQLFKLSFWKVATAEINYRRFFSINDLICVRVEEERVFRDIHGLVFQYLAQGKLSGVRVDHIDGLYDPTKYLERLRERAPEAYITVEKILDMDEDLPSYWPVQGTTGYDFMNYLNGIFCDRNNENRFEKIYQQFSGLRTPYWDLVREKKRLIIGTHMAGDIDHLAHLIKNISSKDRFGSDITLYGLRRALVEVLTLFPVYRTYTSFDHFTEQDKQYILEAVTRAKETNPSGYFELNFLQRFLLLDFDEKLPQAEKDKWIHFVMRLQQFSGPLMAKGFEDTLMYVYDKLLSLNEVGGSPHRFGISVPDFHAFLQRRLRTFPHTMNATSTHDTKRGEDVRARLNVLSELPEEWERKITLWSTINEPWRKSIRGRAVPDANDEYLIYQTMVGCFPFKMEEFERFKGRIKEYVLKAIKEAKVHTGWMRPNEEYEGGVMAFLEAVLNRGEEDVFWHDFRNFQKKIAWHGVLNSLSQLVIKIAAPGVPDFYQGTELWDLNLVDPDNRRDVDYHERQAMLDELQAADCSDPCYYQNLLKAPGEGKIKMLLMMESLSCRNAYFDLFNEGTYVPLTVRGEQAEHIFAFARVHGDQCAITLVPRLLAGLTQTDQLPIGTEIWGSTAISLPDQFPRKFRNAYGGEKIDALGEILAADAFRTVPFALLLAER